MLNIFRRMLGSRENKMNRASSKDDFSGSSLIAQENFVKLLHIEQRRTERSRKRFVLMLVESEALFGSAAAGVRGATISGVADALARSTRETDVRGWYKDGLIIGVIFTEIPPTDGTHVSSVVRAKVQDGFSRAFSAEVVSQIRISCYVFPDDTVEQSGESAGRADFLAETRHGASAIFVKRSMDIAGSLCALALFSPLMVAIAALIKLTSKGPLLFRQRRVGQFGRAFTFLKFRSMYAENNHAVHQEYIKRFIAGNGSEASLAQGSGVYKLTNDPRITPIGRILRETSLDELPQFLNVLIGEMSLVGPRPPIPYEVEYYDIWHKRRFLAVKPGITGLWQVHGRSRTTFDEMVRLDLRYGKSWSLWLDLKILLQTPRAVLTGNGAH
jgi:lipopolysaccharide/colanic/teichoic acid biosynthesis glycosyltransferase